jgi:hypothetical protein
MSAKVSFVVFVYYSNGHGILFREKETSILTENPHEQGQKNSSSILKSC